MLTNLHIENIAVIEQADLVLDQGFHVMTGETGAGKSIVIDAINAVLGERVSKDLIRTGSDRASVSALFERPCEQALTVIRDSGFDVDEDGCLLVSRVLTADGRSQCRINGAVTTVAILKRIGRALVNIHGQHENQALLSVDTHLVYLDRFGETGAIRDEYEQAYHHYCTVRKKLRATEMDETEREQRREMLSFQISELENAGLAVGEEETLLKQRDLCRNAEKISRLYQEIAFLFNGDDHTDGVLSTVRIASDKMGDMARLVPAFEPLATRIGAALDAMDACAGDLRTEADGLVFDEAQLDQIENRLHQIRRLTQKYGGSEPAALAFLQRARDELNQIETNSERRADLEAELAVAERDTVAAAERLTAARKMAGERLMTALGEQLRFLDMPYVRLSVSIEPTTMTVTGGDKVEFLISSNPGEPPKPMAKIASGGEMSRIMLAMKSVLASADDIDTLIFDEIDTGISGYAANKVGVKLKQIAGERQIICVTHLAQIAAEADKHLLISKSVRDGRTYTDVSPLDREGRRRELARIIGGTVTDATLFAADEMLCRAAT